MFQVLIGASHAFCGTFVAGPGDTLYNESSQVVYAREDGRTTLTLANDFTGDVNDFAVIIPVPSSLDEDGVRVVDPSLVTELDSFSSPRLVEYTCEDLWWPPYEPTRSLGCMTDYNIQASADGFRSTDSASTVQVEATFTEGEYAFTLLSADEGDDLQDWFDAHGYEVGADAEDMLQDYIDEGSWFLAARVQLSGHGDGPEWLSPIQLSYESEGMSLPIRLGTLNSDGMQELILYGITAEGDGALGIANLPQTDIDTDCMLDDTLTGWYRGKLDQVENEWVVEHSWSPYHCDPCTPGGTLDPELVTELGVDDEYPHFSRIFVRYDADQSEDLQLYSSGMYDQTQRRYIRYDSNLESQFRICDQLDVLDDGGNCDEEWEALDQDHEADQGRGCSSGHSRFAMAGLAMLAGLALRRRR